MLDLFFEGGILFMGMLTLVFFIMVATAVVVGLPIFTHQVSHVAATRHRLTYVKSVGLFALIFGMFGQLLGLYDAFKAIEQIGAVSQAMLAGGLRVSSISTLYGFFIFLLSYLIWFGLETALNRKVAVE
ncbi:MotA/TolQ/ExbB proton channel family protein [Catalinimonas alkaloidigena]|uniref:MotA/TolQ/ExbB proton channel family protein n=1 Tax=Catalinimonas alkaloidigena TaxID=1075417 RepID=A0A1G9QFY8_9BACT|nr:MotA/TolQ/ExbB proton channel family protein [Catalinimonas alkaloidigena]SDM09225.1 MotA/TolQ/ExbB proton channel family protein [Catalinimonas alkaloidigena]